MEITKVIATNLREARESAGLSREALAKKAGITAQTIYDVENENRKPSLTVLDSLAKELGLPISELLKGSPATQVIKMKPVPLKKILTGLANIPQDVYEMIEKVEEANEAWDTVRSALEIAIEKKQKTNGNKKNA